MSVKDEHVTKAELDEFADAFREAVSKKFGEFRKEIEAIRSEVEKPTIYRCSECTFSTDDPEAFIKHIIGEEIRKLDSEKPKPAHLTPEEFLACPECFPEFEKAFLDAGWKKPEPEKKSAGLEI